MKAALLVGINKYPGAPLRGCVPDVRAMQQMLTTVFGVPLLKTYTLLDGQATKDAILKGLQWLARQNADTAFFVYSGHGTRVPDLDGDEARQQSGTTYDQAIVPIDYRESGFIIDDDLGLAYSTFPAQTKLVVHLDSCFSAKSERGLMGQAALLYRRHITRNQDRVLPAHLVSDGLLRQARAKRDQHRASRGVLPPKEILLLAGCRDFETSADAYLGGEYRGAMTFFVQQAVKLLGSKASYEVVIAKARQLLVANSFPQVPQISGPSAWTNSPIYS